MAKIPTLTWSKNAFYVDGVPTPLLSGEFHYFRVPKAAWRERLLLLIDAGMNTVATYIPWILHEPTEGDIRFDDTPERSLTDFLSLCCELGLMVIARPGPYSYSELRRDGLPEWLSDNYPEIIAHDRNGKVVEHYLNPSYLHPTFLEKARRYIRAADSVIKPFLVTNGGCIVSVQADNEVGGVHIWRGFLDTNREGCGIGREDGHYVRFLSEKYTDTATLNNAYGTAYSSFCDVEPCVNFPDEETPGGKRARVDYLNFYKRMLEIYIETVCGWFKADGIDVPICTNAGSPQFIPFLRELPTQNKDKNFFFGVDHYFALFPSAGNAPTPEKTMVYARSLDMLDELGMPPSVLEMQSGSASAFPPMFPETLSAFYMSHAAFGMKGVNFYVFTGGPNPAGTENNCEIYDYHAPVGADGEIRPIYYTQKEFCRFMSSLPEAGIASRTYDVQLGFTWEMMQSASNGPWNRYSRDGLSVMGVFKAMELTLGLSARLVKFREVGGDLDISKPLIVVTDDRMDKEKQEALISFVKAGGKLMLTPVVPELDEDFNSCTLLRDFLGIREVRKVTHRDGAVMSNGQKIYELKAAYAFEGFGGNGLCRTAGGDVIIEHKAVEGGEVILLGAVFDYSQHYQMDMLEYCLAFLGGRKIKTDSRGLICTLYEYGGEAWMLVMNLLPGMQTASFCVDVCGTEHRTESIEVPAMSVVTLKFKN